MNVFKSKKTLLAIRPAKSLQNVIKGWRGLQFKNQCCHQILLDLQVQKEKMLFKKESSIGVVHRCSIKKLF